MSFDLAIWVGEKPGSDQEAHETFDRLMRTFDGTDVPPDPRLLKCKKEITGHYPDDWRAHLIGCVWTSIPLTPHGSILIMNLTWGVSDAVLDHIARTAEKHGLVCYDLQKSIVVDATSLGGLHESHSAGYKAFLRVARLLGWR
jgi:hypothetical protein